MVLFFSPFKELVSLKLGEVAELVSSSSGWVSPLQAVRCHVKVLGAVFRAEAAERGLGAPPRPPACGADGTAAQGRAQLDLKPPLFRRGPCHKDLGDQERL